jgi:hypothetical protein
MESRLSRLRIDLTAAQLERIVSTPAQRGAGRDRGCHRAHAPLTIVAEAVLQILMEADVEGLVGAARHERSPDRLNYRNGYRDRSLDTRLGALQLRVPKLRQGSYSRRSWSPAR